MKTGGLCCAAGSAPWGYRAPAGQSGLSARVSGAQNTRASSPAEGKNGSRDVKMPIKGAMTARAHDAHHDLRWKVRKLPTYVRK